MRVYIVCHLNFDNFIIDKVFQSKLKAENFCEKINKRTRQFGYENYFIEEKEIEDWII